MKARKAQQDALSHFGHLVLSFFVVIAIFGIGSQLYAAVFDKDVQATKEFELLVSKMDNAKPNDIFVFDIDIPDYELLGFDTSAPSFTDNGEAYLT